MSFKSYSEIGKLWSWGQEIELSVSFSHDPDGGRCSLRCAPGLDGRSRRLGPMAKVALELRLIVFAVLSRDCGLIPGILEFRLLIHFSSKGKTPKKSLSLFVAIFPLFIDPHYPRQKLEPSTPCGRGLSYTTKYGATSYGHDLVHALLRTARPSAGLDLPLLTINPLSSRPTPQHACWDSGVFQLEGEEDCQDFDNGLDLTVYDFLTAHLTVDDVCSWASPDQLSQGFSLGGTVSSVLFFDRPDWAFATQETFTFLDVDQSLNQSDAQVMRPAPQLAAQLAAELSESSSAAVDLHMAKNQSTLPQAEPNSSITPPKSSPASRLANWKLGLTNNVSQGPPLSLSAPSLLPLRETFPSQAPPSNSTFFTNANTALGCHGGGQAKHPCEKGCSRAFTSLKDLHRHYKSQSHLPVTAQTFQCRCGYTNARKDHYRRHLRQVSCVFRHPHFHCVCFGENLDDDVHRHLEHLEKCKEGRRQTGRPRKKKHNLPLLRTHG